jgi:hypothetical protein
MEKCHFTGKNLTACQPLASRIGTSGLHAVEVVEHGTLVAHHARVRLRGVMFGPQRRGVMLNYCPWCGASLREGLIPKGEVA